MTFDDWIKTVPILLKLVPEHRGEKIHEEIAQYEAHPIDTLLTDIPMPHD
ncbi:MAG: hypothetical protein ACRDGG_11510 [Anaerolineae bacterium]